MEVKLMPGVFRQRYRQRQKARRIKEAKEKGEKYIYGRTRYGWNYKENVETGERTDA